MADNKQAFSKRIYMDNAATTRLCDAAAKAMTEAYLYYGNPSSLHTEGVKAAEHLDKARKTIADCIGALPQEIYLTSGGSEADNWALKGVAQTLAAKGKKHIVSTVIEHHAILHTLDALKKQGFEYTLAPVDSEGYVSPDDIAAAIRPDTALVSVMYANNEIGTIQPIREISKVCHDKGALFHCDAVQAVGHIPVNVVADGIDLMSVSAHKFHGPKGIGVLYVRKGVTLTNLIEGGAQERGRRAGTESVALASGMAAALEEACALMDERAARLSRIRDHIIDELLKIERSRVNGGREKRVPGNVSMCFEGVEGEALLLLLDFNGIAASSGSACTSGSLDPSHVLLALGLPHEIAHGSLRISLADDVTDEDAEHLIKVVPEIVAKLRDMSPVWEHIKENEMKGNK
ncbi:MAG: aminotransferase class V-fold PLP-dependent enzyme [Eubacteriales bacterium]|nr:aminotransferase class V-fold PLP-dependent enzyme [Eubacteriales bacterium]